MFDLTIIGDKALERKLNAMDKKVAARNLKDALKESMEPVRDLSRRLAPTDSGLMKRSIRIGTRSNRRGIAVFVRTGTRKQLKIPADAKYYYPAAIEYGTRTMPPRPFLRRALARLKNAVINRVGDAIRRKLES